MLIRLAGSHGMALSLRSLLIAIVFALVSCSYGLVLAAWHSSAPITADLEVTATTLAGEELTGTITLLDERQIVLATAAGDRSITIENLLRLTPATAVNPRPPANPIWIDLIDGTQLEATSYQSSEGASRIGIRGGGIGGGEIAEEEIEVPTRMIATIRFQKHDQRLAQQWEESLAGMDTSDLVVIRRDDNLDYIDGLIQAVTAEHVTLEFDGESTDINRDRVDGVAFYHPNPPQFADPVCILDAGAKLVAKSVSLAEGRIEVTTLSDVTLTLDPAAIADFDFSAGKLMYLGDVEPDSMNVVKYLGPAIPLELEMHKPRRNQSPDGQPITIDGQVYRKGLGIRSRTTLTYRIRGAYSRFDAVAGIDDEVRGKGGSVQLVIRGDDRVLFDQVIDDSDDAVPLDLDVSGVSRLTIFVDFGENQGFADHLDLADARVVK